MATLRELKGRISSVASSQKITGAMKMISSAKMRKAEQAIRRLLPYRRQIEHIIANLLNADTPFSSPLTSAREIKHLSIVVFGSDDGLCGAYNVNIFKLLLDHIAQERQTFGNEVAITIYPIGKKIDKAVSKIVGNGISINRLPELDSKSNGQKIKDFTDYLSTQFLNERTDRVTILYMSFKSVSRQRPEYSALLPVTTESITGNDDHRANKPYLFEPNASQIFDTALPMLLNAIMQDIFSENRASEQAARVMAMQSANDNATKLLSQLQLEYNKLRQQSITTELLDILGGQIR